MTMKSDKWIKSKCGPDLAFPMVEPFFAQSVNKDAKGRSIPSYGLSSFGYDMRLGRTIHLFKSNSYFRPDLGIGGYAVQPLQKYSHTLEDGTEQIVSQPVEYTNRIIDLHAQDEDDTVGTAPSDPNETAVILENVNWIDLHPGAFILGHTEEYTRVPRDVSVTCMGKSTIARLGIIVTVTPLEAGWEGITTLEITNTTPNIVRLYTGWGICQMQFIQSDEECEVSYADRKGKYQFQGKLPVQAKV